MSQSVTNIHSGNMKQKPCGSMKSLWLLVDTAKSMLMLPCLLLSAEYFTVSVSRGTRSCHSLHILAAGVGSHCLKRKAAIRKTSSFEKNNLLGIWRT